MRDDFNGYSYETTLAYFKYTLKNPSDVRNDETRGDWFARCRGITGSEFAKIVRARESETEYRRIMDIKNRTDVGIND